MRPLGLRLYAAAVLTITVCWAMTFPARSDPAYDTCMAKSDGTNTEWGECGGALIDREEQRLNDTWKRVFPSLSPSTQKDLRTEQRAWAVFKDASCRTGEWRLRSRGHSFALSAVPRRCDC